MRVTQLQTNFTAGELSPRLHGRVDIAKYQNGVEKLRDLIAQVYGGAKRRPSSLFVAATKFPNLQSRLIPFVVNATSAFVLEFGHGYVRFFKDGAQVMSGGVPYEIVSPYPESYLVDIDYTQGADTMFLFHEGLTPYKLVRISDTDWTLAAVTFVNTPFDETATYPASTLTPSESGPVGATIYLMAGDATGATGELASIGWSHGEANYESSTAHGRSTGDVVSVTACSPDGFNRTSAITVDDATHFRFSMTQDPGVGITQGRYTYVTPASVFGAGDVGNTVKINGGLVKITAFVNDGVVRGEVTQELSSRVPAPPNAWSVHADAWTVANGYPRTGTLHEQRLICAGSPAYPQTIWGSVTGAYLDFQQGTADDDAFSFTIASDVVSPIKYVASNRVLLAFTTGGEFTIQGGTEKPLAPTNPQIKPRTNYGCAVVRPVRIRDAELFVQRAGRKVRSFGYQLANDDWSGPDVSVLAEHLTEGGIAGLAWQQEPDSIVWGYRGDGGLVSVSLDKDQDVTAWEYHEGFGRDGTVFVESITSIPVADGDEVWLVARRTVDGATVRYIERLSEESALDCAIVATGASSATWSGLDHLEGETVRAVGDDRYLGEYTVSGGAVTLSRACTTVNIGLGYTCRMKLLPPEIQTGMGSASGSAMRTSEITLRVFETTGCNVNGKALTFLQAGSGVLDAAPVRFTGLKRIENLGFDRGASDLEITQEEPMPFHVLSVTRKFTSNDG